MMWLHFFHCCLYTHKSIIFVANIQFSQMMLGLVRWIESGVYWGKVPPRAHIHNSTPFFRRKNINEILLMTLICTWKTTNSKLTEQMLKYFNLISFCRRKVTNNLVKVCLLQFLFYHRICTCTILFFTKNCSLKVLRLLINKYWELTLNHLEIDLVSLFNGISTFVGYLMPKLFS